MEPAPALTPPAWPAPGMGKAVLGGGCRQEACLVTTARLLRQRRGGTLATVLGVFVLLAGALLVGFWMGRNLLGGEYLHRSAARLQQPLQLPAAADSTEQDYRAQLNEPPPDIASGPLASPRPAPRDLFAAPASPRVHSPEPVAVGAPPPPSLPARPSRYTVQVGVFLRSENSQALVEDLRNRGYSGRVSTSEQEGQRVHKVVLGTYRSQAEAQRAARELQEQGYQVRVTPE